MRYLLIAILFISIHAQSYSVSNDFGFIYDSNHSIKNKKKAVFLKDDIYIVYIYGSLSKENDDDDDDIDKPSRRFERFRIRKGKSIHLFNFGSMYERVLIEKRYVDGKFIITADNLRNDQIEEIKKSSLSKEEKDELIDEIEFTDFEQKAEQLSYMVNIIKDHIEKGKLIRL